jgi:phosphoribosylformimino-5-aminoimidazole carboxamide ribonucleotide (ProFAR) isomerase
MEVIPAIDLLGGRVCASREATSTRSPRTATTVAVARRWADEGTRIHVVDLDAAREGKPLQSATVAAIVDGAGVRCQVAGGIRDADQAAEALAAGADRVVLGSALISRPALGRVLVERHGPDRIVAALDVLDGRRGDGCGRRPGADVASGGARAGRLRWFATAIARDGGLGGPDVGCSRRSVTPCPRPPSSLREAWAAWRTRGRCGYGFEAAITGQALYEGAFSLPKRWPPPMPRPTRASRADRS